eukprot:Skav224003  [mRNA]  locus=scaffold2619:33556:34312:+ [translate_table: standard]
MMRSSRSPNKASRTVGLPIQTIDVWMHLFFDPTPHDISRPIRDWIASLWTSSDLPCGSKQDVCQGQHSQSSTKQHGGHDVVRHHGHRRSATNCHRDTHTIQDKKKHYCCCYRRSHKVIGRPLQHGRK